MLSEEIARDFAEANAEIGETVILCGLDIRAIVSTVEVERELASGGFVITNALSVTYHASRTGGTPKPKNKIIVRGEHCRIESVKNSGELKLITLICIKEL